MNHTSRNEAVQAVVVAGAIRVVDRVMRGAARAVRELRRDEGVDLLGGHGLAPRDTARNVGMREATLLELDNVEGVDGFGTKRVPVPEVVEESLWVV